jgi:uncharacterized phiE125 gp8 family phage protein
MIQVVTPPTGHIVSTEEIRRHLRVDSEEDDLELEAMIATAEEYLGGINGILGRFLLPATVCYKADRFCSQIALPFPPIISITHVKYRNTDNTLTTVDTSVYRLMADHFAPMLVLQPNKSWPTDVILDYYPIEITYQCGYGSSPVVPSALKSAVKLLVGEMYQRREMSSERRLSETPGTTSPTVLNLVQPFRIGMV